MNKRKHILFISSWYPTTVDAYNGDFVQRHAKAASLLNNVTVIHTIGDETCVKEQIVKNEDEGVTEIIHYFPKSKFAIINLIRKTLSYQKLAKQVKPYDIVHANVFYFSIIWVFIQRIFGGKPIVLTEHWSVYFDGNKTLALSIYWKLFYKLISAFMPVSCYLKEFMQKAGINQDYSVVPNVVNTDLFQPKSNGDNSTSPFQFLHLSFLDDEIKNYSGILNATKIIADNGVDFKLSIGGNGRSSDCKKIDSLIEKLELNEYVTTFKAIEHHEVPNKMSEADCFILYSHFENQPCVIIESFSVGTPVITSNVGGIAEYFPDNFGILVEKNNAQQLANAMLEVINGKEFAAPEKMHTYVEENFSPLAIAKQFNQVYNSVLNR